MIRPPLGLLQLLQLMEVLLPQQRVFLKLLPALRLLVTRIVELGVFGVGKLKVDGIRRGGRVIEFEEPPTESSAASRGQLAIIMCGAIVSLLGGRSAWADRAVVRHGLTDEQGNRRGRVQNIPFREETDAIQR